MNIKDQERIIAHLAGKTVIELKVGKVAAIAREILAKYAAARSAQIMFSDVDPNKKQDMINTLMGEVNTYHDRIMMMGEVNTYHDRIMRV